jgi:hypothetical protein
MMIRKVTKDGEKSFCQLKTKSSEASYFGEYVYNWECAGCCAGR